MTDRTTDVALSKQIEHLYASYAMSVITARALPDVRDGLKPVQRRILYAMHHELHLLPDTKPAKCARIVGDVMGKYHPHGDGAIYGTLVRMAQDWVMRETLVRGQGNFGSLDGDDAAAYRYTEARLTKLSTELLSELAQKTVCCRANFDATKLEPIVLPARFPNLLVNGTQGIAVGMATSIPPHNLREVCDALDALITNRSAATSDILKKIKGPDFPTGGEIISTAAELCKIYEKGHGTIKVRGECKIEKTQSEKNIVITSIPYGLEKRVIVEEIADIIVQKKLPGLVNVRDESSDVVRIVLELKKDANTDLIIAFLQKHTSLQTSVQVNMTCLVPSEDPEILKPRRLSIKEVLQYFLDFRFEVITKRLMFDLEELDRRLHILRGLEIVFSSLDEIIKLIKKSEGREDITQKLMKQFELDRAQVDAILELKLYRLARLEILSIKEETEKKQKEATDIRSLLENSDARWELVRKELSQIREEYGSKRRTHVVSNETKYEFSSKDFIVDEDAIVIITEHGWVKRQQTVKDLSTTRLKDNDRVLACVAGSMRAPIAFFSNMGICYVCRVVDIAASTGYGDPIQKLFKFRDGEKLVNAFSFDERNIKSMKLAENNSDNATSPYGVAITKRGLAFRFSFVQHYEPSTKNGRKFARLSENDEVIAVFDAAHNKHVIVASSDCYAMSVKADELTLLSGAGKGTILMRVCEDAKLVAAAGANDAYKDAVIVRADDDSKHELFAKALASARGSKGKRIAKNIAFVSHEKQLPKIPDPFSGL